MSDEIVNALTDKAREFGRLVASTDTSKCNPLDLLALCAMCQAIDTFLSHFEKGENA